MLVAIHLPTPISLINAFLVIHWWNHVVLQFLILEFKFYFCIVFCLLVLTAYTSLIVGSSCWVLILFIGAVLEFTHDLACLGNGLVIVGLAIPLDFDIADASWQAIDVNLTPLALKSSVYFQVPAIKNLTVHVIDSTANYYRLLK